MENKVSLSTLRTRQKMPLDLKIEMSKRRIIDWYDHWEGDVSVSFSGGLDSTVLLHLARSIFPNILGVFANTGLEYPENVSFVKQYDNIEIVRPKMGFREVLTKYGFPAVSKEVAKNIHKCRQAKPGSPTLKKHMTGYNSNGRYNPAWVIPHKWKKLMTAPFIVSAYCCEVMKKRPLKKYGNTFIGIRADDSRQRSHLYLQHGCNAFDASRPISKPLAFWTHQDILDYLRVFNIPYSPLYDMGYTGSGCMFCMFGVHLEGQPNRFQRMYETHPKLWKYCIYDLDLKTPMEYIGVPYKKHQSLFPAQFEPSGITG